MSVLLRCTIIPQRFILILMCCVSFVISVSLKASIVVVLHEITIKTQPIFTKGNSCLRENPITKLNLYITKNTYHWNDSIQLAIKGVCFWGELLTALPSGIISDKYGGKWILATSTLIGGIIAIIIPFSITYYGSSGLIIARFFLGCCVGCITPAINSLLSHWIPFEERTRSGVIVYSGSQIGYQLGYIIPVYLIQTFQIVLPVYYFWGIFSFLWFLIFITSCYNTPATHPFIHPPELEYLEYELVDLNINREKLTIPWMHIIKSGPMQAYLVAVIGTSWGFGVLTFIIPNYYTNMLQFTKHETFIRKTISYTFMMFTTIIPGFICDWLIKENIMSVTLARKFWTVLALVGPAIFILFASYADCNAYLANISFTTSVALFGPWYAGIMLNALDLAPNFSGTLNGITHCLGTFIMCSVKPISWSIVQNNYLYYWRQLFWVTFFILCICAVYVASAASGRVQDWNDPTYKIERRPTRTTRSVIQL